MSPTGNATTLHGIHAIVYALFDENEELDRAAMRRQTQLCLAAGVHGMAALGLATEVAKLSEAERRAVMDWVAEDTGGRVPLAFTIYGNSVAEQIAQLRHAESVGANWVILQPPAVGSFAAGEYIRFFGRVAEKSTIPVAIQNAPAFLGRGLTAEDIRLLTRQYPNISLLKGEGSAVEIERVIQLTEGRVPVFNGRAGLELIEGLRSSVGRYLLGWRVSHHGAGHATHGELVEHVANGDVDQAERWLRQHLAEVSAGVDDLLHGETPTDEPDDANDPDE